MEILQLYWDVRNSGSESTDVSEAAAGGGCHLTHHCPQDFIPMHICAWHFQPSLLFVLRMRVQGEMEEQV